MPTVLEWITIELAAHSHSHCVRISRDDWCVATAFAAKPPNTIVVIATTRGPVSLEAYEGELATAKEIIKIMADSHSTRMPKLEFRRIRQ